MSKIRKCQASLLKSAPPHTHTKESLKMHPLLFLQLAPLKIFRGFAALSNYGFAPTANFSRYASATTRKYLLQKVHNMKENRKSHL